MLDDFPNHRFWRENDRDRDIDRLIDCHSEFSCSLVCSSIASIDVQLSLRWGHGLFCSVVELAWLNGLGGYQGRSNWCRDKLDVSWQLTDFRVPRMQLTSSQSPPPLPLRLCLEEFVQISMALIIVMRFRIWNMFSLVYTALTLPMTQNAPPEASQAQAWFVWHHSSKTSGPESAVLINAFYYEGGRIHGTSSADRIS